MQCIFIQYFDYYRLHNVEQITDEILKERDLHREYSQLFAVQTTTLLFHVEPLVYCHFRT